MQYFHDLLTTSVLTTGLFDALDLIGFTGAKVTTDDAPVLGVAKSPNTMVGDYAPVMAFGIARVRAVGIITAGAKLVSAAAGGVQAADGDSVNIFATALTAAADGEFVDILIR
ncbi:capsid cement protein [Paracoccus pantotrophus]|uniref:capsid cement protein n=1 Tax=Paracoccus pantotrophus TaxID=82367 RepID=UPI00048B0FDE|nr:capsid cement protein [Paracoccus pantotrophus]